MLVVDEREVSELSTRFGEPLRRARTLEVSASGHRDWFGDEGDGRRGEIVLVIPRPQNRVLLHTKLFYPPNVFRLMSGGIHANELVADALAREAREETGFVITDAQWLGLIEWTIRGARQTRPFASYIFRTAEISETPRVLDANERIAGFRDVPLVELKGIAQSLDELAEPWRDWGRFRAAPHWLVVERSNDAR